MKRALTSMATEELDRLLKELLQADEKDLETDLIRGILAELRRREHAPGPTSPIWDEDRQCWI